MCTRFYIDEKMPEQIEAVFKGSVMGAAFREGEICPTEQSVLLAEGKEGVRLVPGHFGFTSPHAAVQLNARRETLLQKRMFAPLLEAGRAVVPASRFFEWDAGKHKYAFSAVSKKPLLMAALWRRESGGRHFVIITTEAAPPVDTVHGRMPVLFTEENAHRWLHEPATAYSLLSLPPPALEKKDLSPRQMSLLDE